MAQILVFVDPGNFGALIGTNNLEGCNYATRVDGRLVKLNRGNSLLYVSLKDGEHPSQGEFDETRARSSAFLIIPESLGIPGDYEPKQDFAMLIHQTSADKHADQYDALRHKKHCWALKEDHEIAGSSFALIARQLRPSESIDFDEAWLAVTRTRVAIIKDAFLTDLRNSDLTLLSLPNCLRSLGMQFAELQQMYAADGQGVAYEDTLERFRDLVKRASQIPQEG